MQPSTRVLLAAPKSRMEQLPEAESALRRLLDGQGAKIVNPKPSDWERVRQIEGGWRGMASWAVRDHEALVLLASGDPVAREGATWWPLSRACFDMAQRAIMYGKPVCLFARDVSGALVLREIHSCHEVAEAEKRDWKNCYGFGVVKS